jgi:hypothetical protein
MDNTRSGPETARSLVPSRLLAPQTLRGPGPRSGGLARFGAVLVAFALAGVGGAVTEGQVRAFLGAAAATAAIGASVYDFRSTPAGIQREIGIASAGGFGDRELSE